MIVITIAGSLVVFMQPLARHPRECMKILEGLGRKVLSSYGPNFF